MAAKRVALIAVLPMLGASASACAAASDAPEAATAPPSYANPTPGRELAYQIAGMHRARVTRNITYRRTRGVALKLDVYHPRNYRSRGLPAVLFVHGVTSDPRPKDWGVYVGWGQATAASGMVGITFNHRSGHYPTEASDVRAAIRFVRANARRLRVDGRKICVAGYSAGVPAAAHAALAGSPDHVRCLVAYYGPLDLDASWTSDAEVRRAFSATTYLRTSDRFPPLLIGKAARDGADINAAIDRFVAAAAGTSAEVELRVHPTAEHGFDALKRDASSRRIIRRTLDFLQSHLLAE